jgi:hypothetical protein
MTSSNLILVNNNPNLIINNLLLKQDNLILVNNNPILIINNLLLRQDNQIMNIKKLFKIKKKLIKLNL